jgi:hypothetical protein
MGRTPNVSLNGCDADDVYPFGALGASTWLFLNRLSDNVGGVKQFSSTLQHALVEERHFALVEAVAFALPTQARS